MHMMTYVLMFSVILDTWETSKILAFLYIHDIYVSACASMHIYTYIYIYIYTHICCTCFFYKELFLRGFFSIFFCLLFFFRAASAAHGGSQAGGLIGATAASLHHSHSNMGSEPCLPPTPQLMATLDPQPTERGQGSNTQPHGD